MLVRDCMTHHPVMVSPDTSSTEARRVFVENEIGHLPVVSDGKKLLGLITHTHFSMNMDTLDSLDFWEISRKMSDVKVKQVMIKAKKIITVIPIQRLSLRRSRRNIILAVYRWWMNKIRLWG